MTEGLEVSEVRLSECNDNKDNRIDSDFYTKKPTLNRRLNYKRIGECLVSSQYGMSIAMNEDGIGFPIYRMNEIHNLLCDVEVSKYADISEVDLLPFVLKDSDVLFNRTNSYEWVGRTGIYYQNDETQRLFASYLVRLIPDQSVILPEYLTAFLNCKYGMADIKRRARQSINQTNVNPEEVKGIMIPILPMVMQSRVAESIQAANKHRIVSYTLYHDAELLLLDQLGLRYFAANPSAYNVKSARESFLATGRLDAEYYQPKYEDYGQLVRNYKGGFGLVGELCDIRDANFNPDEKTQYNYIELADIGKQGEITGCSTLLGADLPSRARRMVHEGDVVVSSVEGSLASCALVPDEYEGALCSTGFYVLRSERLNPETLLTLFKSLPVMEMMRRGCSGTILTAIARQELERVPLPLIRSEVQEEIAAHVRRSFALQSEAKRLLDEAKLTVEQAIEITPPLT